MNARFNYPKPTITIENKLRSLSKRTTFRLLFWQNTLAIKIYLWGVLSKNAKKRDVGLINRHH